MRHRIYGSKLGRNKDERSRLFKGLLSQLFLHGTIQTSETKARAIKGLVDKVINLVKEKRTQGRVQSFLTDKNLQERLIKEIVPKLGTRTSGYTSLIRVGSRLGDQTMMVKMSLIGAEQLKPLEKELRIKNKESRKETDSVKKTPRVSTTKTAPIKNKRRRKKLNS